MADQVNPTGSLAPGLSQTQLMAARPQPAQETPRAAKTADAGLKGQESRPTAESAATLDTAVKEFMDYLRQSRSDLMFQVDESSGHTYFKIVNAQTKAVIRQVPSEEILAMARKLRELVNPKGASGVLMDREG